MVGNHLEPRIQHVVGLQIECDGRRIQIVGEQLHALMEQRHPVFHAGIAPAFRNGLVDRIGCRALAVQIAPVGAETRDAVGIECDFAHRPQRESGGFLGAALGRRIETADALDCVAEQVEADRVALAARKDVDDAAAHGEFAGLHHRVCTAVTVLFEVGSELFRFDHAAGLERQRGSLEHGARRHALYCGIHRGEHDALAFRRL